MECEKPAKAGPNKGKVRTGTPAGYQAHKKAGEEICESCKVGNYEYSKAYREANAERINANKKIYREENRERVNEKVREWHHANKEYANAKRRKWTEDNKERKKQTDRRYRAENKEKISEYHKEYQKKNKRKLREYFKGYYEENRGKWEGYSRKRRSIRASLPIEDYSPGDVTAAHGTICDLCGTEVDVTLEAGHSNSPQVDHVHPISRDGCPGDVLSNVRWTHAICNITKGNRMNDEINLPLEPPTGDEWDWSEMSGTIADEEGPAFVG